MDTNHHHHATTASQTQQQTFISSPGASPSLFNPMPSTGAVPTTTAGPITISLVVALTLVICMILNCGKLKRRVNSQRYNNNVQQQQQQQKLQQQQQGLQETIIVNEKSLQDSTRPSLNKSSSPWSSSSTLLTPHAPAYIPPPRQVIQAPNNLPLNVVSHPRR